MPIQNQNKSELCPKCQGRGLVIRIKDCIPYAVPCSCMEQKRLENILKNSRITPHFQKLTFKNFVTTGKEQQVCEAYQMAVDYVAKFKQIRDERFNSIAFLGQPGTGKTHLSCAIANALMAKGVRVLYFPHREGFGELKSDLRRGDGHQHENGYAAKIKAMKETCLLVWDDLFKGRGEPTGFEMDVVFEVLNYRYLNHLPIVLSSERTIMELLQLDEAVGSRIQEMANNRTVLFDQDPTSNHRLRLEGWYSA